MQVFLKRQTTATQTFSISNVSVNQATLDGLPFMLV